GVAAVFVASDLNDLVHEWLVDGEAASGVNRPFRVLADGDVRFVGEPIAMVVADSRYRAEDAVDAVEIEIDPLPPALDVERALDDDAPLVHPATESNLYDVVPAPDTSALDAVFADAPV